MNTSASSIVPRTLDVIPLIAVGSVGYVLFVPGAVPGTLIDRFGIGYTAFGLLTSAPLLSIILAQAPSGYLTARYSTTRVLLVATIVHVLLAITIDVANNFLLLLILRTIWGLIGGAILTVGATHIARLHQRAVATRQQGLYGGVLTLGGAISFLLAPPLLARIGLTGLHTPGALLGVPAIVVCWWYRNEAATTPRNERNERGTEAGSGWSTIRPTLTHPVVLVAALCYMASLGSYVTLSTFITAYFDSLGVSGPLNALVLLVASSGRAAGGVAVAHCRVPNRTFIAIGTAVAVFGFGVLAASEWVVIAVSFPLIAMIAVSFPFGAIYGLAGDITTSEGIALAVVIAAGNFAALVLPAITGAIRDATGEYAGGFVLLGVINAAAVAGIIWLQKKSP
jgi:nitrate/nitrite transporter NarK